MVKGKKTQSAKAAEAKLEQDREAAEPKGGRVFPESEANTANEHATSAGAIAEAVDGDKKSGAKVNAEAMDKASEQLDAKDEEAQADEDNSLFGRIRKSGLVFNDDQITGLRWVGPSIQNEPDVDATRKMKTIVRPLDTIGPQTGMLVYPDGLKGKSFSVPDGFNGPAENPDRWGAVTNPHSKKALFG